MIYIVNILLVMSLLSANTLSLEDNSDGTWNVNYSSDTAIGGFQFNLDGATASAASGGEAGAAGFMVSPGGSTVLGFSFSGATIPAGDLLMTILTVSGAPTGLSGIAISDINGSELGFTYDDGSPPPPTCDDMDACNYGDEGDCDYPEDNYDCDGVCIVDLDCNGDCGGSAVLDCAGECGGSASEDNCGVCGGNFFGDPSGCADVSGCTDNSACNYNSEATDDDGSCEYAADNFDCDGVCIVDLDCNGDCGGSAVLDCAGECGGSASEDNCGVCGGDDDSCLTVTVGDECIPESLSCLQFDDYSPCNNCTETWRIDCEGTCSRVSFNYEYYVDGPYGNYDCVPTSEVLYPDGTCSSKWNCEYFYNEYFYENCNDCNGTPNGTSLFDDCGVCEGDNSSCSGCTSISFSNYDSSATIDDGSCICDFTIDECGECGGDNSSCWGCTDPNAENFSGDSTVISCGYDCCSYSSSSNPVQFESIDLGGYLNPGETIDFKITAYNGCSENLLLSSCQISTQNPYVTIVEDFGNLNNIDQASNAETSGSFVIQVSDQTPPGMELYFQVKFVDTNPLGGCIGEDNPSYDTFFIPIQPFNFLFTNVDDDDNPDSNGDGDNLCEPNETIEFLPIMESVNSNYNSLYNITGTLGSNDTTETEIYVIDEQSGYGYWTTSSTSILVWDGIEGASGIVSDTWTFNSNSNGWIPEYDYVFDYKLNEVKEVSLIIYFEADWSSYTDTLRWYNIHTINEGYGEIGGCTDESACNYNENATQDDSSCWFPSNGCTCDDPIGAQVDCANVCGGDSIYDDCGICGGDNYSPESLGCAGDCPDWECPENLDLVEQSILPISFDLSSYPNPFNPSTRINYSIPYYSNVLIQIYNLNGKLITEIVNNSHLPGEYSVIWDASNHSSGVYFVRLITTDYINTEKLLLIK